MRIFGSEMGHFEHQIEHFQTKISNFELKIEHFVILNFRELKRNLNWSFRKIGIFRTKNSKFWTKY